MGRLIFLDFDGVLRRMPQQLADIWIRELDVGNKNDMDSLDTVQKEHDKLAVATNPKI